MIRRRPMLPIVLLAALVAAAVPAGVAFAGNGGDSEEEGTPSPDPVPGDDGDESVN